MERRLGGYSPWDHKESDMTAHTVPSEEGVRPKGLTVILLKILSSYD